MNGLSLLYLRLEFEEGHCPMLHRNDQPPLLKITMVFQCFGFVYPNSAHISSKGKARVSVLIARPQQDPKSNYRADARQD